MYFPYMVSRITVNNINLFPSPLEFLFKRIIDFYQMINKVQHLHHIA